MRELKLNSFTITLLVIMPGVSLGYIIRCEATCLASTAAIVYSVYCCIMIFELRIKENR